MSAVQTFDRNAHSIAFCLYGCVGFIGRYIYAAGTADIQFIIFFGVQIHKDFALQLTGFQPQSSGHSGFFVNGEQGFQSGMSNIFRCQHRHDCGNAYSVIGAQCGAVGFDPVTVDEHFYSLGIEIKIGIVVFLANHIQVRLHDNGFAVFHSPCCGLADDDIAGFIYGGVKAQILTEILDKGNYSFFFL